MGLAGGRTVVGARGGPGGDSRPPGPTEGQGPLGRWKRPPPAVPLFRRNPSPPGSPSYSGESSTPVPLPARRMIDFIHVFRFLACNPRQKPGIAD
jgi:hypothetical protein